MEYGEEFLYYVQLVIDNICKVQPANAFKSSSKLALKPNSDGYDLQVFFIMVIKLLEIKALQFFYAGMDTWDAYFNAVCLTDTYVPKANKLGVNKQQLYDDWVFNIRKYDI